MYFCDGQDAQEGKVDENMIYCGNGSDVNGLDVQFRKAYLDN